MKKHLFFAATAALVLASCSSDSVDFTQADVLQAQDDNSVQFDTYMGKTGTTRAYTSGPIANNANGTAGVSALSDAEFGVFAYQTTADYDNMNPTTSPSNIAPNFMYNQQITWNSSNNYWTYDPVKYWPNGIDAANAAGAPSNTATSNNNDKLSFFAVAPFTTTPTTDYNESWYGSLPTAISYAGYVKTNLATNGINSMTTNGFTGNVWVKYLMPNANEAQAVDLLWGTNGKTSYNETDNTNPTLSSIGDGYNMNLTKQYVGEKVKFLFKHALAKIGGATSTSTESLDGNPAKCGFKVVVDVDGNNGDKQNSFLGSAFTNNKTLVTLKEVKIQDGKSASDDPNVSVTGKESNWYKSGWFNIEQGTWDMTGATKGATYNVTANSTDDNLTNNTYTLNEKIKEAASYGKYGTSKAKMLKDVTGAEWSTSNPTGVTATVQDLFCNENVPGLMAIPGGSSTTLYITVDYVVRTADPNLSKGYTEVEQKITNEVSLASLESNKYYTIIMHLGLTSVKFEALVADWETANNGTFDENGVYTPGGGSTPNETKVWLPSNVVSYAVTQDALATATSAAIDISSYGIGNYVSSSIGTDVDVANVTGSGTGVTVNFDATNTTTTDKVNVVTIVGELGKVTVTLTHKAGALAVSGTGGNAGVTGFSVTDAATNPLNITKAMLSIKDELSNNVGFTTNDDSNVGSIDFDTDLTAGKTYTITVKYGDATGTKVVSYE